MKKLLATVAATVLIATGGILLVAQPAVAAADPSFKVTCYPTGKAPNDPIVFQGQAGKAHMHTFYGGKGIDENTTVDSLLAQPSSQCGSYFDTVDLSAYWIPTLMKNGQEVYSDKGGQQLAVYYRRAGGPSGAPVDQAFPRGLRIIAGDMRATTPQLPVSYACAKIGDSGQQRGGTSEFVDCGSDEVLIAKLVFPDCWDGVNLDSADHKSHMAYSGGPAATCPASHPVKVPQVTFEAWYHDVDLSGGGLAWSSGSAYTFHGDIMSAWDTTAAANLVNQCINAAVDCNPLAYPNIPQGAVAQSQIDAQLTGTFTPGAPAPSTPTSPTQPTEPTMPPGHDHGATTPPTSTPTTAPPVVSEPDEPTTPAPPVADPPLTWRDGDLASILEVLRAWLEGLFKQWGVVAR